MLQQVRRLAKSTLVYGMGQIVLRFVSLLLLPLFTSYLTPAEYGISAILGLLTMVVTPVFQLGMGTAIGICYFDGDEPGHRDHTIWTSFLVLAVSTSILAVLGLVFAREVSVLAFQTPDYAYFVRLSTLNVGLGLLVMPFLNYLQLEERALSYVVITVLVGLVSIVISIYLVVSRRMGLEGVLIATVLGQAVGYLAFMVWSLRDLRWGISLSIARKLLRLGLPLIPSFAFVFIIVQGNKYFLQWFSGLDTVGIYGIGFNIGFVMSIFVGAFTTAWTPFFLSYSSRQEEAKSLFGRLLTYYILGFGALSLGFYVVAKPLVMVMTAAPFREAFAVVGPAATAQYLIGVFSLLLPGMYFANEVGYLSIVQGIAAVVAIACNLLLIPFFGARGAALALVAGTLAMVVVQQIWNYFRRRTYLAIPYQWRRVLLFSVAYAVYMFVLLRDRSLDLRTELIYSGVVAMTIPIVIVIFLGKSEWTAIRGLVVGLIRQGQEIMSIRARAQ